MPLSSPSALANWNAAATNLAGFNAAAVAFTPSNNSLVTVIIAVDASGGTRDDATLWTLSGGGYTWTNDLAISAGTSYWSAIAVFNAQVTTGVSTTLTLVLGGGSEPTNYTCHVYGHTGYNTSSPLGATVKDSQTGSGAITLTLSGAPASTSNVLSALQWVSAGSAALPQKDASYTSLYAVTVGSGEIDSAGEWITGSNSTSVPWASQCNGQSVYTSAAVQVAFEIKAAAGGETITMDKWFQPLDYRKPRTEMIGY